MSEANEVLRNHYHPPGATIYIEKRLTNQSYRLFSQPLFHYTGTELFHFNNSFLSFFFHILKFRNLYIQDAVLDSSLDIVLVSVFRQS